MKPLISVILPAKNAGLFLAETLDSVLAQSYEHWECICVNDHSSDHTAEVLKKFSEKDKRFVVLENNGSGVISALQRGYSSSTGVLITRMDADDLMPEHKLAKLSSTLLEAGRNHVATGKVRYFNALGNGFLNYERWLNELVDQETHWAHLYKECVIASPNWMVFREDFDKIRAFNSEVYPEDYELVFRMYAGGLKVVSVKEVTHLWRDHEERASRTSELYADNRFLPLKMNFWKTLEFKFGDSIVLVGAGKKGKALAKELQRLDLSFKWFTNNPKKIGHDIYGVTVESLEVKHLTGCKTLIAVSSPPELLSLKEELMTVRLSLGQNYWVLV